MEYSLNGLSDPPKMEHLSCLWMCALVCNTLLSIFWNISHAICMYIYWNWIGLERHRSKSKAYFLGSSDFSGKDVAKRRISGNFKVMLVM